MPRLSSDDLAVGLLFVAIAVLSSLAPFQSDTWWHLKEGSEILRRGSVSLVDNYSHTASGLFFPNHEWLTEVIWYAAYRLGGLPLVTALCAMVILATWAMSWRLATGPFERRFVLFAGTLVVSASGWAIRPQVFSMAMLMVVCALYLKGQTRWLPILFVIWANLHGAVALGLVAVCAGVVADAWQQRKIPWALTLMAVVCGLATLVSPLGVRLWTVIPASIERSRVNQLIEWQAPGLAPLYWPFWGIAAALVVLATIGWRHMDVRTVRLVAIASAFIPLAVGARRNVPVFLLVGVPALTAVMASRWPERAHRRNYRENKHANAAILGIAAATAMAGIAFAWWIPAQRLGWRPIDAAAVSAIRTCGDPMYNTYGDGGVLIWFVPDKRVFIDNRQDPYPLDLLRANRQLEVDGMYEATFERYGITCAVVPPTSITAQRLSRDVRWSKRYGDSQWSVFIQSAS